MELYNPFEDVRKAATVPPQGATTLRVLVPTGRNVGHGLDLKHARGKGKPGGRHGLEVYRGRGVSKSFSPVQAVRTARNKQLTKLRHKAYERGKMHAYGLRNSDAMRPGALTRRGKQAAHDGYAAGDGMTREGMRSLWAGGPAVPSGVRKAYSPFTPQSTQSALKQISTMKAPSKPPNNRSGLANRLQANTTPRAGAGKFSGGGSTSGRRI